MKRVSVACAIALQPLMVHSGELTFTPVVDVSTLTYETEHTNTQDKTHNNALLLKPSLATTYKSQLLKAALRVENTTVRQSKDSATLDKEFTDYNFNSKMGLWDQRIQVTAQSNRSHRALFSGDSGVTDPILNAEDLSTVQSNNASFAFFPKRPSYLGFSLFARAGESRSQSTPNANSVFNDIDSETYSGTARLYQGREFKSVYWDISNSYQKTKRKGQNDITSESIAGKVGVGLFSDLHLVVVGSDYQNEGLSGGVSDQSISSTSYGGGLEWRRDSGRFVGVTYNKFKHEDRESNYVGFDINWPLSTRSAVQASYDKRFFGDNYNFSLTHNSRSLRTRMGYDKGFTSYSRLQLVPGQPVVLICPQGNAQVTDCYIPDSPSYEPDIDEVRIIIPTVEGELTDEVIVRESAFINLGYDKRKVSIYLNYNYGNIEYLESNRAQRTRSAQLSLTYKMGPRTRVNLQGNYSRSDALTGLSYDQEVRSYKLSLARDLNKQADVTLALRYLDRDAGDNDRSLQDTRLSLDYSYKF
ncbi:hypothetical protein KJY73_14615 [Bowmanella sp. Y26]|uniref:hypothetical protein n=1 Tax=Bowmanella yangjiangensis TaxID=2811230 RepID=UPI001BDC7510|nr:hypothetical protein [Bowmanella yangjiangensis]MBT1064822.1 hypothetical protein [Bowmanella yangjiangensis]